PASGTIVESLPLGLTITGTDNPSTATIPVVQSRCDQHSVADDKKGTLFPLDISTPRGSGTLTLKTSEKTRSELFQYLGDVCHWG
ncbi:MAG TPA: hypothetical protein PK890_11505, partial [Terrimesophilobacter sp.]|nr:hypothetical protein [Terrimesophilobacter sp.]